MKRLNLEVFKAKNLKKGTAATSDKTTDKLLGQVLGDCHDSIIEPPVPRPRKEDVTNGQ